MAPNPRLKEEGDHVGHVEDEPPPEVGEEAADGDLMRGDSGQMHGDDGRPERRMARSAGERTTRAAGS
jgi:hypothetical protein